ncbi:hypothetical protein [Parasitella parasitica]|uniref:Mitochondrial distribution and morphology protein 35 n=1 Tax=Parasitella parasitica TaxID=35722 RepID=A0A0B7N3Q5_9FUNG|nr:hypothetical protein [Parasitella parasitica]
MSSSVGPDCTELKQKYDNCFNKWYSEKFLKGDTTPECEDLFKDYRACVMFDTETQAKKNLEKKYTDAFKTVFPNRQRITGKSIDVGILYAEAQAERKTLMEGYKTLEAGVSEARRAILNDLNANTNESRSEVDEVDDADKENEEDIDDDHDYASNGYNIKQGFREFTTIRQWESTTAIVNMGMRVDKHLVGELESVMTTIENSSRKNIKCQIFQLYEAADDLDTKVLDIFLAYVDKLPEEPLLNHEIKEIELITKYLDPLLNGMLNNHDKNHSFMWTNTQGTGTDDERPDAEMFFLKQRTVDYTVGYCEVKINESNSNSLDIHYDMLRLTKFGKNIFDEENLESALIVMVVVIVSRDLLSPQKDEEADQ